MMKKLISVVICLGFVSTSFAIDLQKSTNLDDFGPALFDSIYSSIDPIESDPTGDTFSAAPLLQDGIDATYTNATGPASVTFDTTTENAGDSINGLSGDMFMINEAYTVGAGPTGGDLIQVQMTAVDAAGAQNPWVAAGVTGPNGPFLEYRFDVASPGGGSDPIALTPGWMVTATGFSAFASTGSSYGTFQPLTLDTSSAAGMSGAGVIGLSGADIAGFDLSAVQLFWEIKPVPEPSTGILGLVGVLVMMMIRRRS